MSKYKVGGGMVEHSPAVTSFIHIVEAERMLDELDARDYERVTASYDNLPDLAKATRSL